MRRRPKGKYKKDEANARQNASRKKQREALRAKWAAQQLCAKAEKWNTNFLPGVFILLCPHGVVYGIFFMEDHESPQTIFDIIFDRFEVPPSMIIYDNACHADSYCLGRQPAWFANTSWMIDRVHQAGHVRCSEAYNLDTYFGNMMLELLNTQVAEQFNSILRKHSKVLKFMKGTTAMSHCIRVCARANIAKITKVLAKLDEKKTIGLNLITLTANLDMLRLEAMKEDACICQQEQGYGFGRNKELEISYYRATENERALAMTTFRVDGNRKRTLNQ